MGRQKQVNHNHLSAAAQEHIVLKYIQSELRLGRLVGPLPNDVGSHVHTTPIGLIPKPYQVGKWRLIVDLS